MPLLQRTMLDLLCGVIAQTLRLEPLAGSPCALCKLRCVNRIRQLLIVLPIVDDQPIKQANLSEDREKLHVLRANVRLDVFVRFKIATSLRCCAQQGNPCPSRVITWKPPHLSVAWQSAVASPIVAVVCKFLYGNDRGHSFLLSPPCQARALALVKG